MGIMVDGSSGDGDDDNSGSQGQRGAVRGAAAQKFFIQCWGLKANTVHKAYLVNKDVTADCKPIKNANGGVAGTQLRSDANGYLQFDYNFKPGNAPWKTKYASDHNVTVSVIPVGPHKFKVSSTDGSSFVEGVIENKGQVTTT